MKRLASSASLLLLLLWSLSFSLSGTMAAQGTPAAGAALGRISGVVFDSVRLVPAAGVNVWVTGTTRATISDEQGRYLIDSVVAGSQVLSFSSSGTDSLGFGPLGAPVNVRAGETTRLLLATPSFDKLWRVMCATRERIGADSGIAWGTVQDAETNSRLDGAPVMFQWYEFRKGPSKKMELLELSVTTKSDSTGTYVACGLPADVALTSRAIGNKQASGDVSYLIGQHLMQRVDLTVSAEMFGANPGGAATGEGSNALGRSLRGRGTSTIRGIVMDERGRPLPEALVSVSSADTVVRTDRNGLYVIRSMPAGTQSVEVRSLGFAMMTRFVNVRPGEITESNFKLSLATTLATFNVRAEKNVSQAQQDFLFRRKMGMGWVRPIAGEGYSNALQALNSVPRITVSHNRGTATVTMRIAGDTCVPAIYLDGRQSSLDEVSVFLVDNMRTVEVFNAYQVPIEFQSPVSAGGCGVIAYWSKFNFGKVGNIPPKK